MNFRVTKKPRVSISKARSTARVTRDGKETALVVKVSQNLKHLSLTIYITSICDALRNLVSFAQFKKRKKHLWKNVTFSKGSTLP